MSRFDPDTIYTDGHGRPFKRPRRPGPDATSEERGAYIRAVYAYHDAITDCGNRTFNRTFRAALRRK